MGGEVGRWVGVGGTFGVGVGRKIREKTAHLFLNSLFSTSFYFKHDCLLSNSCQTFKLLWDIPALA